MIGPGEVMIALIVVGLPMLTMFYGFQRFFKLREKRMEIEAMNAAEKAAQYASRSRELEERVRVLEQIATDTGTQTAAQIEALRQKPRRIASEAESADNGSAT